MPILVAAHTTSPVFNPMGTKTTKFLTVPFMALSLLASGIGFPVNNAKAAIAEVSTISAPPGLNFAGFPIWYEDISGGGGDKLQACLGVNADGTGLADPNCILLADVGFNPAQAISFPGNFPSEFFYYIADTRILNVGPTGAGRVDFRAALEGSFAGGAPLAGDQITFLRINLGSFGDGDLTPNSTFTVTHPFGPAFQFTSDVNGAAAGSLGNQAFRAEDGGVAPGDFTSLLPATTTGISQFINAAAPIAPAGYIGNPAIDQTVAGGVSLTITGPNIGGAGVDTVSTNLFSVAGKIFAPSATVNSQVVFAAGNITITGTVSDPTVTVNVTVGANTDVVATVNPNGTWSVTVPLTTGNFDVTVTTGLGLPNESATTVAAAIGVNPPSNQTHRFRSLADGRYLFSSDPAEIANINATLQSTWVDEGPSFKVLNAGQAGGATAHRFRSLADGRYLFSADPAEINTINTTLQASWVDEGPAFAVVTPGTVGAVNVDRFRSLKDGRYLLTADPVEIANIKATLAASWVDEGTAFALPQ